MGMMINRRRVMGGRNLPYDAEIEYLESTGTQWIDTLVNQKETQRYLSVEVNIQVLVLERGEHDVAGSGSGSTPTMGYSNRQYFTWANDGTSWNPKTSNTNWHNNIYTFFINSGRTFSEDGVIYQSNKSNNFTGGAYNTLFLFASSPNRFPLKCWLKSVKIIIDDIVRFDAISVRVGTTGYLYDKVSKQLFGNAGTGDFILGPDKGTQNYTEIEYLESTGTQFIDTDYTPIIGDSVHVEFTQPINNTFNSLYSAGTSKYQLIFLADKYGAYLKYFATGDAPYFDYKPIKDRWYVLDINGNGTATIDNYTITSTPQNALDGNSTTLWLLLRRNNAQPFVGKIRRFWLENNGVRKIDFIPVRVGQVGYMYDKVSGQLFGNSGTGDFILGNDI